MKGGDIRENEVYSVPSTESGLEEHPSSSTGAEEPVGEGPSDPAVADASDALSDARLDDAVLARWDSIPVAAASPITPAESKPMIHDRMNTRRLHPRIVFPSLDDDPFRPAPAAAAPPPPAPAPPIPTPLTDPTAGCDGALKGEETVRLP